MRSILMLIALLSGHCAVVRNPFRFGFLENISLWDVTSSDQA
ncbi:hypothetical protein ACNKHU_26930 [Shigella flexneri]